MPYPALGRARRRAPADRGRSGGHPSSNPTCNCVVDIQGNEGSCSAGEAWKGKGAWRGASVVAHLDQDLSKQQLGRWKLHRLKLLEREHPFAALTGVVACQFDPTCCGAREGLGGEARAPLVILACVCLDGESAADPTDLLFALLARLLRRVPGEHTVLQHKVAFLVCCLHHAAFLVEPSALLLQLYSPLLLLFRRCRIQASEKPLC